MIINRAFFRETSFVTAAVLVILMTLFVMQGAGGLFARTGTGQDIGGGLLALILLYPLVNLASVLSLSMFIGLLVTLSRWYRDSEMVVLQACGIGTLGLLRPVMRIAGVFFIILVVEAFMVRPWVMASIERIEAVSRSSNSSAWISSRTFNEIKGGVGIFYAEKVADDGVMHNVFFNQASNGSRSERVTTAKMARRIFASPNGDEFLEMLDGTSYRGSVGTADYQIVQFEKYRIRINPATVTHGSRGTQALPTLELFARQEPASLAEWHLRLSKPVIVIILAALALALSYSDPRRSRYINLFIAIFLFFVYVQSLAVTESLLRQGKLPAAMGLWGIHAIFAAMSAYFLWRRSINEPLISLSMWKKSR